MINETHDNPKLAECIGLWLAEGDNKCKNEITFTNSEFSLVDLFHKVLSDQFKKYRSKIRLYIYSKCDEKVKSLSDVKLRHYSDKRARRPYYIWRLASVELHEIWRFLVNIYLKNSTMIPFILRGFFAGEGNLKESSHNSRVIRIAQKKSNLVENLLNQLKISFKYREGNRAYWISSKANWDIFAKHKLSDLHPLKKELFWKIYSNFKEAHYNKGYLKEKVLSLLTGPKTTKQLSKKVNRTPARVFDVIHELKKGGKVFSFKVGSLNYWTTNSNVIIISKIKQRYLRVLIEPKTVSQLAKIFKVTWKSAYKRLNELEKLNLVRKDGVNWLKVPHQKELLVI